MVPISTGCVGVHLTFDLLSKKSCQNKPVTPPWGTFAPMVKAVFELTAHTRQKDKQTDIVTVL